MTLKRGGWLAMGAFEGNWYEVTDPHPAGPDADFRPNNAGKPAA
jgi:hypothetical protein